ncbi:MAG: MerR family transcriptional regulator [Acidobacteriota bacterium]|jgi:MerR family transcriptional regulator/heat shock protein HspR|nr:MAG: MerR family transcriptional regulator [Acidobacteriota bacterium]
MADRPDFYLISMAAELLELHPQTLRKYERLGLVRPARTLGSMRVYTRQELERLRLIKALVEDEGINLAGVQRLLSVADVARRLRPLVRDFGRRRNAELRERLEAELADLFRLLGLEPDDD